LHFAANARDAVTHAAAAAHPEQRRRKRRRRRRRRRSASYRLFVGLFQEEPDADAEGKDGRLACAR
jgi:hypothetical protein